MEGFNYSEVVQLKNNFNGNFVTVNPNPFKEKLVITIGLLIQDRVTFVLTDVSGQTIIKRK